MSQFQQQLVLVVHEPVDRALHLWDLMIKDAPILSEMKSLCLKSLLLCNLLPFL